MVVHTYSHLSASIQVAEAEDSKKKKKKIQKGDRKK